MDEIDLTTFRNLIEDEGCVPTHQVEVSGIPIQYYFSFSKSTRVAVSLHEEILTARTAADLLIKLELEDVIERLGLKY